MDWVGRFLGVFFILVFGMGYWSGRIDAKGKHERLKTETPCLANSIPKESNEQQGGE